MLQHREILFIPADLHFNQTNSNVVFATLKSMLLRIYMQPLILSLYFINILNLTYLLCSYAYLKRYESWLVFLSFITHLFLPIESNVIIGLLLIVCFFSFYLVLKIIKYKNEQKFLYVLLSVVLVIGIANFAYFLGFKII